MPKDLHHKTVGRGRPKPRLDPAWKAHPGAADLARLIVPERLVELSHTAKAAAFDELIDCLVRTANLSPDDRHELEGSIDERESEVNTQLAPGWAVPHGRLTTLDEPLLVVGRSTRGIPYGPSDMGLVHLIFLFVSSPASQAAYLSALSGLARIMQDAGDRVSRAAHADSPMKLMAALGPAPAENRRVVPSRKLTRATRALTRHVLLLADEIDAGGILLFADTLRSPSLLESIVTNRIVLATRGGAVPERIARKARGVVSLPHGRFSVDAAIQLALTSAGARGLLGEGKVIVVCGEAGSDELDNVRIETPELYFARLFGDADEPMSPEVFERALQIVLEMAEEGREGHAIGATLVLGDAVSVKRYTRQLTINPFHGYEEHERSLLDPTLEQTIKELSLLDGAFIIDGRGVIQSAGTYLSPPTMDLDLASGVGTRHRAAAGLTRVTAAIAIVLSQSGGRVSVFRGGVEVMHLTPPRARSSMG